MPTTRGWAALGVGTALAALWVGFGEDELLAAGIFLVMATLGGVGFVRLAGPKVFLTRRISPPQVHEGDEVVVELTISTIKRLRNLTLEDTVHGLGVARFAAAHTVPDRPLVARYQVRCGARGIYQVGPASAAVSDPFSLAERRERSGNIGRLTVYPRIERLEGFPAVRGRDTALQATRPTYAPHGGEDFFTLREYQVGDDLRKVHWPSSAKRDTLMIKQLEIPWQARALVLLDQRAGRYLNTDAFEHAVRGAASAIAHLHRAGFTPDLWTAERPAARSSANRYLGAMEVLTTVQPKTGLDLAKMAARLRRTAAGGGALVLVTGEPDEGVAQAFRAIAKDFNRAVVMSVAEREADLVGFQRTGAVTVAVTAEAPWAPAWQAAMDLSWSTASA